MEDSEKFLIGSNCTLLEAVAVIKAAKCRSAIIVDGRQVVGVLSQGDVLSALLKGADIHSRLIHWLKPDYIRLESFNLRVARRHVFEGITLIPVVGEMNTFVGAITCYDVFRDIRENGY